MNHTIERSQVHATFVIERTYSAPVEAVWHALSDNDARDEWFNAGSAFDAHDKSHDFRVGGQGTEEGRTGGSGQAPGSQPSTHAGEHRRARRVRDAEAENRKSDGGGSDRRLAAENLVMGYRHVDPSELQTRQ